jgi:hypothetical protein
MCAERARLRTSAERCGGRCHFYTSCYSLAGWANGTQNGEQLNSFEFARKNENA